METKFNFENNPKEMISTVLERLSDIVDLEIDSEPVEMQNSTATAVPVLSAKKIDWLNKGIRPQDAVNFCRETFRLILNYLQQFYKQQEAYTATSPSIDHIKSIMVLVGEAAKKLDVYTSLFHKQKIQSMTSLSEYKQLQEFYQNRIAHQIDDTVLGKWIWALSQQGNKLHQIDLGAPSDISLNHVFVDLESVQNDSEYELFFIRKEDGSRFFEQKLLRNIKLMSDFTSRGEGEDVLADISSSQNLYFNQVAQDILNSLGDLLDQFYQRAFRCRNQEIVVSLNMTLMALMLSGNPDDQLKKNKIKSSESYFQDFLFFLSEILQSSAYHKLVTYFPSAEDKWKTCLVRLVHVLCQSLYTVSHQFQYFIPKLNEILSIALMARSPEHLEFSQGQGISMRLANEYAAMLKICRRHPSGPVEKTLSVLSNEDVRGFDPMSQVNLPNYFYELKVGDKKVNNLYIPSPTTQEYINKANVLNAFRGFLRSYHHSAEPRKHLLINLQDRTEWKEFARCSALEGLHECDELNLTYSVATVAKDNDFYNQQDQYEKNKIASSFLIEMEKHLQNGTSGYFFMDSHKDEIVKFVPEALKAIHKLFFSEKNILLREHRLDFIEIFDLFLILKLIDIEQPDSFSLTCKDGIDTSSSVNCLLYIFLKMMEGNSLSVEDWDQINMLVYAPAILVRERAISKERFNRMLGALKAIELVYKELGEAEFGKVIRAAFGSLYGNGILEANTTT